VASKQNGWTQFIKQWLMICKRGAARAEKTIIGNDCFMSFPMAQSAKSVSDHSAQSLNLFFPNGGI
jgi:hypothetical protein